MSSEESHWGLVDSIGHSADRLCEGNLCCLQHRRKVSAWLYKIYHRVDHPMNESLKNFVAARNTRVSAALCKLALVISHCRTDQSSWSFSSAVVPL